MSRWNESEFIERAGKIAHDHVVSKKPLNDLAEKVARDENLQPDEIRTMVRLANVATFQELFKRKDDGDKMIEFESGDPEAVINRIVTAAQEPLQSANINNDKLASAWDAPDMMRAKRRGATPEEPAQEKTASAADDPSPRMRQDLAVLALRKLAEEFEIERISAGQRWESITDKLSAEFKKAPGYGPAFSDFEKDAYADHGMDAWPELKCIRQNLRLPTPEPSETKVAELQERRVTEASKTLALLQTAIDARADYTKFASGLEWIQHNMPAMGR